MRYIITVRHKFLPRFASLFVSLCLLSTPAAASLSAKGQKNYKTGLECEAAQQWEKAAEEFALAVSADPSNAEYQLHYRRSVFNASQIFMQQGATLFERGEYLGAYNAFRRAYGYDQANELAHSMMERALQRQMKGVVPVGNDDEARKVAGETKITPTAYVQETSSASPSLDAGGHDESTLAPLRSEQLRVINYSGDLENFIKYLARQIRLNVVFDRDFPKRNVEVDLQEVSAAQAIDYIFLTQGLFFQKLSSRTILVADQTKRPQYQQLVLRTFYLFNVDPNDARQLIQAALPPQAGRQPVITPNKSTNSITVRDTPENVRLVGDILKSIDKERAEVVMDVNIYEVSRNDLLQFGNQLGTDASLQNLGGIQKGLNILGGSRETLLQGAAALAGPTALGAALIIPSSTLNALQRKDNTRLIASTQVHAFDGEKSTAHIGQRVPVQTASVSSFGSAGNGDGNPQPGVAPGLFGGTGYPVIQYEKTGLTLEFTPQVFPDLDVQVKMSIKSNDVANTGGTTLTPTFTERNIEGTARIQNNRTMMIASVAQNQQSRGRQGLPVLGLVPIFGRIFTAPRRNDSQTDIVIAVTPHVMRAPAVTAQDEEVHPSGTLQTPNSDTLEAMLRDVTREEQFAAARLVPKV
ncbi:MAG: secretin N-terminal domain-containing protein [Pyrinomonadaceae bacterium]